MIQSRRLLLPAAHSFHFLFSCIRLLLPLAFLCLFSFSPSLLVLSLFLPLDEPHELQGPSGLVQGVAWDPLGSLLACQSGDKRRTVTLFSLQRDPAKPRAKPTWKTLKVSNNEQRREEPEEGTSLEQGDR